MHEHKQIFCTHGRPDKDPNDNSFSSILVLCFATQSNREEPKHPLPHSFTNATVARQLLRLLPLLSSKVVSLACKATLPIPVSFVIGATAPHANVSVCPGFSEDNCLSIAVCATTPDLSWTNCLEGSAHDHQERSGFLEMQACLVARA